MVTQIEGGEDEGDDDGQIDPEEDSEVTAGKHQAEEGDLGVAAGEAVPWVVLQGVEQGSHLRHDAPFKGALEEMGEGKAGPQGGNEDIAQKGEIIPQHQKQQSLLEDLLSLEVEEEDEKKRQEIIGKISEGEEIGQEGMGEAFEPYARLQAEDPGLPVDDEGIGSFYKVRGDLPEAFVDEDDVGYGIEVIKDAKGPLPLEGREKKE